MFFKRLIENVAEKHQILSREKYQIQLTKKEHVLAQKEERLSEEILCGAGTIQPTDFRHLF